MSGTTGTIPLQSVVDDQLITPALWNGEFGNISSLMDAAGCGGHSDTDSDAQIQTAPYPGSVLSKATSIAGEIERIRNQLAAILGTDYWYKPAATDLTTAATVIVPVGGVIDYPVVTPPSSKWHLADGTAISRAGFPTLFSLIGTTFGIGDGATTFNLPNYTDRMSIAAGNLYAAAATGGAVSNTPAVTDPGHNHTQNSHTHTDSGHTHSTPAHTHVLAGTGSANRNAGTSGIQASSSGGALIVDPGGTSATSQLQTATTTSGGSGTSGSGTASISTATPTNNANTTGISVASVPTLPPYLGMYKLIRVL